MRPRAPLGLNNAFWGVNTLYAGQVFLGGGGCYFANQFYCNVFKKDDLWIVSKWPFGGGDIGPSIGTEDSASTCLQHLVGCNLLPSSPLCCFTHKSPSLSRS